MNLAENEQGDGRSGAVGAWLRLLGIVVALGFTSKAYWDHFYPEILPWWQWLSEWLIGVALILVAVPWPRRSAESTSRRVARWVCGVGVLVALVGAIAWVPRPGLELEAAVAIVVGLVLFALARWLPFGADEVNLVFASTSPGAGHPWRAGILGAVAVALVGAACILKGSQNEFALAAWILGLLMLLLGAASMRGAAPIPSTASLATFGPGIDTRLERVLFVVLLMVAISLRFWAVGAVPALIDADEGRLAGWAKRMWEEGFPDAFAFGWNSFGNLSYMLHYVGVQLLGSSHVSVRVVSAVIGVVSLLPMYYWVRHWWGSFVALLATALLIVNVEHLYWSRVGFNNIDAVLVATALLATFARALRTARPLDWACVGIVAGLGFHTYHATKLYPALLAGALSLYTVGVRGFLRRHAAGLAVAALAGALAIGPQFVAMYEQWGSYVIDTTNRNDVHVALDAYARGDTPVVREHVARHVLDTLYVFLSVPHELTVLRSATAVPFLLAVGLILWRWRDPRHIVLLLWIVGVLVFGGMMTSFPPSKQRMVGMVPAVCVVLAVFAGHLRLRLHAVLPRYAEGIAFVLCLIWLNAALYQSWNTHFVFMPERQKADVMTNVCRAMTQSERPLVVYSLGANPSTNPHLIQKDCLLAADPERKVYNPADDHAIAPLPPEHVGAALITLAPQQAQLLPLLRFVYPQAQFDILRGPGGALDLDLVRLTRPQIEETRGLRATYRAADGSWQLGPRPNPFPPPGEPIGLSVPAEAPPGVPVTWRGMISLPVAGAWQLQVKTARVRLAEREAEADGSWSLAAGWWPIEVAGEAGEPLLRPLEWRRGAQEAWTAVPRPNLSTQPWPGALLGRYFGSLFPTQGAVPSARPAVFERLESVLAFEWGFYDDETPPAWFAARPGIMEWTGSVDLGTSAPRLLRLETTAPAEVFLDGQLVLKSAGSNEPQGTEVVLPISQGRVPILVRSVRAEDPIGVWRLRLLWSGDGKHWTPMAGYLPPGM